MFNSNLYSNPPLKKSVHFWVYCLQINNAKLCTSICTKLLQNSFYFPILNLSVKNLSKIRYLIIKKLFAFIVFPTSRKLCTSICTPCKLEKKYPQVSHLIKVQFILSRRLLHYYYYLRYVPIILFIQCIHSMCS